jgi:transposase
MRAYSIDLRERVLAAGADGTTAAEVADTFGVSESWVRRLRQRHAATGQVGPTTSARYGPAPVLAAHHGRLRQLVRDHPGLTAAEYRGRLGAPVSVLTVWRALRRLGLTVKKSAPGRPSRTARTSPAGGRSGGAR